MFKRQLERSMARIFQERQEKYVSNLSAMEAHRCADAGTPCPWGWEEGWLPKRGCFGQHRQRNPMQGCGVSIPAKGWGKMARWQSQRSCGTGKIRTFWYFLVCYTGKGLCGWFWAGKLSVTGLKQLPAMKQYTGSAAAPCLGRPCPHRLFSASLA